MLFTVNKSSITSNSFDSLLRIAPPNAPILFYEDGAFIAKEGTIDSGKVKQALADHPIYVIDADVEARGVTNIIDGIQVIGFNGFVELIEENEMVPWL
jgi:tRNA 2-thiouridine synthesizing protein B